MEKQKQTNNFKTYKSAIIGFSIAIIVLLICWGALYGYCQMKSKSLVECDFSGAQMKSEQNGISVDIGVTKSWKDLTYHKDNPMGCQYDVIVSNSAGYNFVDWEAELTFSNPPILDSCWNGIYEVDGNTIYVKAIEPVDIIQPNEQKPFGAVLYVKRGTQVTDCKIKGHWDINMTDTGWFWALVELSILVALSILAVLYYIAKQRVYNEKIEHDAMIIEQSMKTLTGFIDAKDAYTKDHSARVADYAREIGRRIGMPEDEVRNLYYITLLHDCGKIAVPDEILKKEGALTPSEFAIVKTHTTKGKELLKKFTALEGIGDGAHFHHERYDGYGYPTGLEGDEIPLYARIICVADAYDAMSSNRCYRKALDKERILSELELNSGKQFDPKFVSVMIKMINDGFTEKVKEKYPKD